MYTIQFYLVSLKGDFKSNSNDITKPSLNLRDNMQMNDVLVNHLPF